MIEAAMLWNEPNNLSHWNFELDPGWTIFSRMVNNAADAIEWATATHSDGTDFSFNFLEAFAY